MKDKNKYIEELQQNPSLLKTLPKEYLTDKDIIKAALVRKMPYYISDDSFFSMFSCLELFEDVDNSLRNDTLFIKDLILTCSGYLFQYLPENLRNDKEIYLYSIKHSGFEYVYKRLIKESIGDGNLDFEILKNLEESIREFLLTICITEYAGKNILNDKETILIALERDPLTFQFLNDEMKSDVEISNKALSFGSLNMRQINKKVIKKPFPKRLKHIEDLKKDPYSLKKIPKEYLTDKEIIKAALVRPWNDYEFNFAVLELFKEADKSLRYDVNFVKELMKSCTGYLFEYLPSALRDDEEILFFALQHSGFDYVYEIIKAQEDPDDEEFYENYLDDISYELECYVSNQMTIMKYAGKNILNNKEVVLKTLEFEEYGFSNFGDALKDDKEVALDAVNQDATNYTLISDRLKDDEEIALAAAEGNGEFLEGFYDIKITWDYLNTYFFTYLSDRLKHDKLFLIKLIQDSYGAENIIKYIPVELKDDRDIVALVITKDNTLLKFASERLKKDADIIALIK